jgi:hypothetical protein
MAETAAAQGSTEPPVPIPPYDHRAINKPISYTVALRPGQRFAVTVLNTCEAEFDHLMYGVPRASVAAARDGADKPSPLSRVDLPPTAFDPQFGSYLVRIVRKQGGSQCVESAASAVPVTDLNEVDIVIAVNPLDWEVGQDAALSLSIRAVKKFFAAPGETATTKKIARESNGEESARLGFATLTHIYPPAWGHGPVAGFGAVNNEFEYYVGWSFGIGPRVRRIANVALGGVFTPVTTLPPGLTEGQVIPDGSVLNNLPTKHMWRFFVGMTATFFRTNGDSAAKPQATPP